LNKTLELQYNPNRVVLKPLPWGRCRSGDLKMNQIRAKHTVTGIGGRLKNAGKLPVLRAVCSGMDIHGNGMIQQNIALLQGRYSRARAIKTHIADLPVDLQRLLTEEFEREIMAFRAKLESDYAEIKRESNELAGLNEQQSAMLEFLRVDLKEAYAKIAEQARRIVQLENEISAERNAL